jgi:hypothetical protein
LIALGEGIAVERPGKERVQSVVFLDTQHHSLDSESGYLSSLFPPVKVSSSIVSSRFD